MTDWNDYPNFSRAEFECNCGCGAADMDADFMAKLQALRTYLGFPFTNISGYRCPAYNTTNGYTQTHATGKAVDFYVNGRTRRAVLGVMDAFGFTGVGIAKTFIHLDTLTPDEAPRPTSWTY